MRTLGGRITWEESAKLVQHLLDSMVGDENGPPLTEQVRFFRNISSGCDCYATEIAALLNDNGS